MREKEIRAIYEQDLDSFLEKLELLEPFKRGELSCAVCNETINKKNFKFVFSENGEVKVCCNKLECYRKIISKIT